MKSPSLSLVLILGLTLAGCAWNPFHKMYSATAEMQIRLRDNGPMSMPAPNGQIQIEMQMEFMQTPDILTAIIKNQTLDQIWAKRLQSDHDVLPPQQALDHLRKVLKIEAVPGTNIVKVTASSEVPQEAADIANALVDTYKAQRDQEEAERNSRGIDSLREQITQQQKVVDDKKAAVEKHPRDVNAQRDLVQQQSLLDALNIRLKQVIADQPLEESPVRIISRALPQE